MEETEKAKIARPKSLGSNRATQIMTALTATTIRGIVNSANEANIKKEDIVSFLKDSGQFVLVYFK